MKYNNYSEVVNDKWRDYISTLDIPPTSDIVIFGCGDIGTQLLSHMDSDLLNRIICLCDNNKKLWDCKKNGYEIKSPEYAALNNEKSTFIIAVARGIEDIKEQLISLGVTEVNIRILRLNENSVYARSYLEERLSKDYVLDYEYPAEASIPVIHSVNPLDKRDFRIYVEEGLGKKLDSTDKLIDVSFMDDYESSYGKYIRLDDLARTPGKENSVKIMITCSHKDYSVMQKDNDDIYVPIQVGRALTDTSIYDVTDNTGENISDRNYNYCECSALYWAWKNGYAKGVDYLGLRHYRRRFEANEESLKHLKENEIGIVHLDPIYHDNIRNSFVNHTKNDRDWDVMKDGIKRRCPDYYSAMLEYENQHFVCGYNMNILRRDIFDEYCKFLFDVLFYIEEYYLRICDRRDRYLGFLAENLFGVFLIKNKNKYRQAITKLVPYIRY